METYYKNISRQFLQKTRQKNPIGTFSGYEIQLANVRAAKMLRSPRAYKIYQLKPQDSKVNLPFLKELHAKVRLSPRSHAKHFLGHEPDFKYGYQK